MKYYEHVGGSLYYVKNGYKLIIDFSQLVSVFQNDSDLILTLHFACPVFNGHNQIGFNCNLKSDSATREKKSVLWKETMQVWKAAKQIKEPDPVEVEQAVEGSAVAGVEI